MDQAVQGQEASLQPVSRAGAPVGKAARPAQSSKAHTSGMTHTHKGPWV